MIEEQLALREVLRADRLGSLGGWLSIIGLFVLPVILPTIGIVLGMESRRSVRKAEGMGVAVPYDTQTTGRNAIIAGIVCLVLPFVLLAIILVVA